MHKTAIALLLSLASALSAQDAYLVKDLNLTASDESVSSSPEEFFRHGSRVYFAAYTPQAGVELFSTDGTAAGTAMVANIAPNTLPSFPSRFISVNGNLLFNARDMRGEELWITDGTAAGTRLFADINSGPAFSSPGDRIVIGGKMLFSAEDGINGRELWSTDGTPAGTRFFKDLLPGPQGSEPRELIAFQGAVYFGAADGLWKTDGTEAGTVLVKQGVYLSRAFVAGSRLFFWGYTSESGTEPWVSDGTAAGTHRVMDIMPGPNDSVFAAPGFPLGDRLLFHAYDQIHGSEWWISDGTAAGTQMLLDGHPDHSGASIGAIVHDGIGYFVARTPTGTELFRTDGTPGGTTLLRDVTPDNLSLVGNFVVLNGTVHFVTSTATTLQLWKTDGTPTGTVPVFTFDPGLGLTAFTNIDGTLYFSASSPLHGYEPWKSDGTAAGTSMIANLGQDPAPSSSPFNFKAAGDALYFDAWDGDASGAAYSERSSFWRTDGTPEGTVKLSERKSGEHVAATLGGSVFFMRDSSELWMSDGTPEGTVHLTEFQKRFPQTYVEVRHVIGDRLLVHSGDEMWTTTLAPGAPIEALGTKRGFGFTALAGRTLFFTDQLGNALWITDGTAEGTSVVKTIQEQPDSELTVMGGHVWFTTFGNPGKLWRTDGTFDGTVVVATLPEAGGRLTAAGNRLFFIDGRDGNLWTSDGTAEGTRELSAKPFDGRFVAVGNSVVFTQSAEGAGRELWISDGTADGTRMLYDVAPGAAEPFINNLTAAGGLAFFSAFTAATGVELWVTDGTAAGTKLAADVEAGTGSSHPTQLTPAGGRLYFSADTAATGRELWAIPLSLGPRLRIDDVRIGEADASLRFTVTLSSPATQNVSVHYETSNGTASAGSDYDASAGTLTFAVGESSKTFDVHVRADAAMENNEAFLVTLRNASGAAIERTIAAGIIEDDDRLADVGLALDFSTLSGGVTVNMTNAGPATATNLRPRLTATPDNYGIGGCGNCRMIQLAPGAQARAFAYGELGTQQYVTATLTAGERDPNTANNSVGWTANNTLAMNALSLAPGGQATVWFTWFTPITATVESSDPAVLTVPSSVTVTSGQQAASFAVHAGVAGTATIRVSAAGNTLSTLVVHVVAPGTAQRWPGGIDANVDAGYLPITSPAEFTIRTAGTAPFSGATATGIVTMTVDGQEVGRVTLTPEVQRGRISFYLADVGSKTVTLNYSGDANFLPATRTYDLTIAPAVPTLIASAVRTGTDVLVRIRLAGSRLAAPTGTVAVDGLEIPLTSAGQGVAEAEVTLHNVNANRTTLGIFYQGDGRYRTAQYGVAITDGKRRTSRH